MAARAHRGVNMTAMAMTSSNCKRQTCPLVREGASYQQIRNCLTVIKSGSGPQMGAWHKTDWPTERNFDFEPVESYSCGKWEAGSWGRGQFGNPEEGERPPLKAATKQR
jgi:hypothetical protein